MHDQYACKSAMSGWECWHSSACVHLVQFAAQSVWNKNQVAHASHAKLRCDASRLLARLAAAYVIPDPDTTSIVYTLPYTTRSRRHA